MKGQKVAHEEKDSRVSGESSKVLNKVKERVVSEWYKGPGAGMC